MYRAKIDGDVEVSKCPIVYGKGEVGYELIEEFFVDNSGIGGDSESALTFQQFLNHVKKGRYYGIRNVGRFQVYIGEYKKKKHVEAKMEEGNQIFRLARLIEHEQVKRLYRDNLACQGNLDMCKVKIKDGKKYTKLDVGGSGKYMIDKAGEIYGIKAYGVINKKHHYGNLNTINEYNWGGYVAIKK